MREKRKKKVKREAAEPAPRSVSPYWYYGLVLLVVLLFALIRIRMLDFPLERDEGEYAYAGQLILQGIPPYQLAYNMKLPGTYAAYSLILAIFGQTSRSVHMGLLLLNTATIILMYFLAARLFGKLAGIVSCAGYALLSAGMPVRGFTAHATHFVVLPAIGGLLLLLKGLESRRLSLFFWSGLLAGLAFIMKQPGIFFVLFSGLYLVKSEWKRPFDWNGAARRGGLFLLGAVLPFSLTCLILFWAGVFPKFWFWTFSYALEYATAVRFSDGLQNLWVTARYVIGPVVWIWIIAGGGLLVLLFRNRTDRACAFFAAGFLLFSFAAVCPGLYFREHYFILLLPAIALLAGIAVGAATKDLSENRRLRSLSAIPVIVFLGAFAVSLIQQQVSFFEKGLIAANRDVYEANPFFEAVKIADYLRTHSSKDARVAILGSEPEIYFYSGRRSATGYIYTYALMERHPFASAMQQEMISEMETNRPEFMVYVFVPNSWGVSPDSDRTIFSWADRYARSHYEVVGIADILADRTEYRWDNAAKSYQPRSPYVIYVFRRTT
jgi:hypothetical protein